MFQARPKPECLWRPTGSPLWRSILAIGALLVLSPFTWAEEPAGVDPSTLAVVEGRSITLDQLQRDAERPGAPATTDAEGARRLLDRRIRFELLHAEALRQGYDRRPEVEESIRRLLVDRYLEENLLPELEAIHIDEDAVASYYQAHREEFSQPAAKRAAIIRVTVPATASESKRAELRQRVEAARQAAQELGESTLSLGSVAVAHSDHQSTRYRGGEIGWLSAVADDSRPGGWPAPVLEALQALERPGSLSPVVETDRAYWLVKLMEVRAESPRPLEAVHSRVEHRLYEAERQSIRDRLYDRLAVGAEIRIFADRLPTAAGRPGGEPRPPANPGESSNRPTSELQGRQK